MVETADTRVIAGTHADDRFVCNVSFSWFSFFKSLILLLPICDISNDFIVLFEMLVRTNFPLLVMHWIFFIKYHL